MIAILVIVHGLAVTVWTGGHLVPDLGVLPVARRERNAERVLSPEAPFEPLPIPITDAALASGSTAGLNESQPPSKISSPLTPLLQKLRLITCGTANDNPVKQSFQPSCA